MVGDRVGKRRWITNGTLTTAPSRHRSEMYAALNRERRPWYRVANVSSAAATIDIFDEIGPWGTAAQEFVRDLRAITADTINLHLNSRGGDFFDGVTIHTALRSHRARKNVYIDGLAASAASFIAMAGDRIEIAHGAQIMIHDGLCFTIGNAADHREAADLLDSISDDIARFYARRAGGDPADWRGLMRRETWYNAQEAVDAGLADAIQGEDSAAAELAPELTNAWDLSVFRYAGREAAPAPQVRGQAPADADMVAADAVEPPPATGDTAEPAEVPADDAVHAPDPADPVDSGDPLGLTPDQRTTSDLAATLPAQFVTVTDAQHPADDRAAAALVEADPGDDWTRAVAALLTPLTDDGWDALAARLANYPGPAIPDDPFARLREASA